jgi:hypothetical protein
MPRKLLLDSLRAELNSVSELLLQAKNADDPVGELQYSHRQEILKKEIEEIEKTVTTSASVALFFGGSPVYGSRGIAAEFAGGALEKFQDLVTRTFAKAELGPLGRRGPIPKKGNSQLMVTELARGSFGFVLDEMSDQSELQETALKLMVDEVARIVEDTGSPNEPDFEAILEYLEPRTLIALKDFFVILDEGDATIRIVDSERDFVLDKHAVHRGRLRTEATTIEEKESFASGQIMGFLPEHRKFELRSADGETIYGSVDMDAAEKYQEMVTSGIDVVGRHWQVKLTVRTVKPLNRPPREVYRLVEFMKVVI